MQWFFVFFFVSGFCSILYEIIWLRLAMAQFGVTSALVAIVLSVFMAGLGLGSWGSGRLVTKYEGRIRTPVLRFYALTELLIGLSALVVPYELMLGRGWLRGLALSSFSYYLASGVWIALTLIPWCACMGATIPIAMLAIRRRFQQEGSRSFSYLYLANVCGAVAGALLPPLLVELRGFHGTLRVGAGLNLLLAAGAFGLTLRRPDRVAATPADTPTVPRALHPAGDKRLLVMLFATGLTSLGMEMVWIRQFTPYLGTAVYTFASILGLYLAATFAGSRLYRLGIRDLRQKDATLWALLALCALLPVMTADPYMPLSKAWRLVLGIFPFSALLGFITPQLVDRWSQGDPDRAGSAYAVNVVGCILGPLVAGFLLLPIMSERWVLLLLAVPLLAIALRLSASQEPSGRPGAARWRSLIPYGAMVGALAIVLSSRDYYEYFGHREVRRDHTATVVATGEGMQRRLLVNGIGMTLLHPLPKMMAHLPLAFLPHPPKSALVVCFGMGTTYRSALSWGIPTTVVELVPSVPRLFPYYHEDAQALVQSPLSRIVIDDGRRFLERTRERFDVITLDPPPPIQAAGSSLLYSKEFYEAARQRLRPGGILQQWLPTGDDVVRSSVTRAMVESFPYVRVFHTGGSEAENPGGGFQYLGSDQPLPAWTAQELAEHTPPPAQKDLLEWSRMAGAEQEFNRVLTNEVNPRELMARAPWAPALQDDRPENEYYVLRRWLPRTDWQYVAGSGSREQTSWSGGN
jgi:spermidine synthase